MDGWMERTDRLADRMGQFLELPKQTTVRTDWQIGWGSHGSPSCHSLSQTGLSGWKCNAISWICQTPGKKGDSVKRRGHKPAQWLYFVC